MLHGDMQFGRQFGGSDLGPERSRSATAGPNEGRPVYPSPVSKRRAIWLGATREESAMVLLWF